MSNTVQKIKASTTNTAGLMATPAIDLTHTGRLPYVVDQARQHPTTEPTNCPIYPEWCADTHTGTGEDQDHGSNLLGRVPSRDGEGEPLIDVTIHVPFGATRPVVQLAGEEFTPAEARTKAIELRRLADKVTASDTRVTYLAAALYVANIAYKAAIEDSRPAKSLDNMCDALPKIMTEITASVSKAFKVTDANAEFAESLRAAIADRLWAFTAVEYARIEAGDGYGYLFDLLADNLRNGADPHDTREIALAAPQRIRDLNEAAA